MPLEGIPKPGSPDLDAASTENMAILALARANVYNLLAGVYAEPPSARLVQSIVDGALPSALRDAGLDRWAAELEGRVDGKNGRTLDQEMEIEYARLFSVPGPDGVAPYQSLYLVHEDDLVPKPNGGRSHRRLLWGGSTVAVQRAYSEAGLTVGGELRDVPDHIGLELQFMHHLCSREAEALNSGMCGEAEESVRQQRRFLENHLLLWLDAFCQAVSCATDHPFYQAMAALTLAFVHSDAQEIGASPGPSLCAGSLL